MAAKIVLKPPILTADLWFKQGADAAFQFTVVDAAGNPITDSTGYVIVAQIRSAPNSTVLFTFTSLVITYSAGPPAVSTLTVSATAVQTAAFGFTSAVWDCFITSPAGKVACVAEGAVTVDPSVTH